MTRYRALWITLLIVGVIVMATAFVSPFSLGGLIIGALNMALGGYGLWCVTKEAR